jgi:uridine kinase
MTILRDRETERGDFIFYADRLSTLVVEKALSLIPYQHKSVNTPLGLEYKGVETAEKVSVRERERSLSVMSRVRMAGRLEL